MKNINSCSEMSSHSRKIKDRGQTVGLVPTMGALHDGHLELIKEAKKKCDVTVVSIFVNPLQFGPNEDFKKYPRSLSADKKKLEQFDPLILFTPKEAEFTSPDATTAIEVSDLSKKLCGKSRQGHFRGVATIVAKLFNVVKPDFAFFGEKDYQQQLIVKKLVQDLNYDTKIITIKTVREFDGLAMSSRNIYLNERERKAAAILYKSLIKAKESIESGEKDPRRIHYLITQNLGKEPAVRIDYALVCDPETLDEVKTVKGPILLAVAALIGHTRLIDNMLVYAK